MAGPAKTADDAPAGSRRSAPQQDARAAQSATGPPQNGTAADDVEARVSDLRAARPGSSSTSPDLRAVAASAVGATPNGPALDDQDRCKDLVATLSLDRDEALRVADLFKVLGDPTRVLILQALTESGELCVHHLAESVGMSQSSVSHHLRLLRTFGLIRFRRRGREVYYRPDDDHVEQLIGVCVEHVRHKRT